jgi:hypothetical protein
VNLRNVTLGLIFMLLLITGCTSIPFHETPLVSLDTADTSAIVERFKADSPEEFQLLNTIVFEYQWRKFSGLGLVAVNMKDRTFSIACINQLGVNLFELTGNKDGVTTVFVMPEFTKQGDFGAAVGEDIKRIYFDLLPSSDAKIEREKYRIVFRQSTGLGRMEYIFAGPEGNLIEKNYYEDGATIWTVSYYEYTRNKGKLYPTGTILKNNKYGYRLIVKLKEIQE